MSGAVIVNIILWQLCKYVFDKITFSAKSATNKKKILYFSVIAIALFSSATSSYTFQNNCLSTILRYVIRCLGNNETMKQLNFNLNLFCCV